jgi:geranylgeranyl pyrophosphate synthase
MAQTISITSNPIWELPRRLGMGSAIADLKGFLARWLEGCDVEVREIIKRQISGRAKYFRPVTLFACHQAVRKNSIPESLLRSAAALELTHNVSLIVDDILDRSRYRRGDLSLHCRFGFLPALMTAGYITAATYRILNNDPYSIRLISELMQRLGVAECLQWRLRRRALGVEDWRRIAGEDTGSMFEICARLGTRDDRLRKFGHLLGVLYHGCDDVGDVRGTAGLGGGSARDIQDGVLTLPAAVALRDPETALLFGRNDRKNLDVITEKLLLALPEAEDYLDKIAAEAEAEARVSAEHPETLIALIGYTRELSSN